VTASLLKPGFFATHDGDFNLVRLMHFYKDLKEGQFPIRWDYEFNYRFGSPIFAFFYPLMFYLGSLVHFFGPGFGDSFKILIFLATAGSVMAMYSWLRNHFDKFGSFFGSLVYLYVPYRLLVTYVTGSFGILLSLLFLPMVFLSIDKIYSGKSRYRLLLSIAILGIMTSHNVTALILLPVILLYLLIAYLTNRKRDLLIVCLQGLLLGFGLSAFFVIPALTETKYIFLGYKKIIDYHDHFLSFRQLLYSKWGYGFSIKGFSDDLSFQIGAAQWLVVLISLIYLAKKPAIRPLFFLLVFLLSIVIMLPVSVFVWERIPLMSQMQFPWRLLILSLVSLPFLAGFISQPKYGKMLAILLIGLLFYANRNYLRPWEAVRYFDAVYQNNEYVYFGSSDIAEETRPKWVLEGPDWMKDNIIQKNQPGHLLKISGVQNNLEFEVAATKSGSLVLNRFYYPIWEVTVDGRLTEVRPTEKTGLVSFDLPAGKHAVVLKQTKTQAEKIADLISLTSLVILIHLGASFLIAEQTDRV